MHTKSGTFLLILVLLLSFASGCILDDSSDETLVDSDGDGVQDKYDACPAIAGEPSNQGCPTSTPAPTTTIAPTTAAPTTTPAPTTTIAPTTAAPTTAAPTTTSAPTVTTTATPTYIPTFTPPVTFFTFTAIPTISIPPNLFTIILKGHYEPAGLIFSGISDLYIVNGEDGSTDVHVITWNPSTLSVYKGYFEGYYDDGDIIGAIDYTDREEVFTISKNNDGTITVAVDGKYDGGGVYAYSTTLEWVESVTELGMEYYIENYTGVWINIDSSQRISNMSLGIVDANTLQASVITRCGDDYCEWNDTTADMYPGRVLFSFDNDEGDTLEVEFVMTENGAVTVAWEIAYNGGGIAAGSQSLFSFKPIAI